MTLFLLDAYALIYRAYYGFINKPLVNSKGLNTGPIYGFLKTLQEVLNPELTVEGKKITATHIAVCFDPKAEPSVTASSLLTKLSVKYSLKQSLRLCHISSV